MSFLRHYLIAVQFFTRVPVTGHLAQWIGFSPAMLRASAAHFPGVGWLVGIVACSSFALIGLALPDNPFAPLVAAVGSTIVTALLTGGFHESGLARASDGLGTQTAPQKALEIMKGPHIGGFGTMALVFALLAKVSLLAVLAAHSPVSVLVALLCAHVLSRFWPLLLVRTLPYLGDAESSRSKPLAGRIDSRDLGIAAAWCVMAMAFAVFAQGLAPALAAVVTSGLALLWMRRLFVQRLQGFNGDCLGATQQVCEIAFYLGAAFGIGLG